MPWFGVPQYHTGRVRSGPHCSHSYGAERSYIDQRSTHDTHPAFNPVSPMTHSSNSSVARGDTICLEDWVA